MGDQLTGKIIADKYRIDTHFRNDDAADFYRGRHLFMDKPVMLKILPPALDFDEQTRKRFSAEAQNAVLLEHPNVLAVSDFGTDKDGTVYIVFEGFEGDTLKQAIARDGRFPIDRAVAIAKQIADAVSDAHEKGFVHANLTPENILVADSSIGENVKVFDFGAGERSSVNVAYYAPEQFSGQKKPDSRSDVYSLGIILYQMLAGQVPFIGETPTDVKLKHAEEPPPPLSVLRPEVPASVETVMQKALSKDPEQRYQTANELAEDLDQVSGSLLDPGSSGNNIWKTAFVVLAGISVLAVALIYATSVKRTNPTTQLQPDANGQPVQPINPATGTEEQSLAAMPALTSEMISNSNMTQPPGTLPGGDNYNPWASGQPPPGAPPTTYVAPGGQVYTIDPNNPSQFMPMEGGVVLVPIPANTNTAAKPTPTPRTPPANANTTATPVPTPAPKATPVPAKPVPTPARTPVIPVNSELSSGEPEA